MDDKKIDIAARKYASLNYFGEETKIAYNAYKKSAHWAIEEFLKELWHDAKEEPRNTFLVEYPYRGKLEYSVDCTENMERVFLDWRTYVKHTEITRWLCVDDLLPKQKGGESNERV